MLFHAHERGENTVNYVQPIKSEAKLKEIERVLGEWAEKYRIMFLIGIYSGLRISDILPLKVKDVYGRSHIDIREKKTRKAKRFRINRILAKELDRYCVGKAESEHLIPSGHGINQPLGARRAYDVIRDAGAKAAVGNLGTHSMRKTFGYHYYQQTGDIVTLQKIFNHASPQITLRYIGIEQDAIDDAVFNFRYKT